MGDLVGIREFARFKGVHHSVIQEALQRGRIGEDALVEVDGKKKLDKDKASKQFDENKNPANETMAYLESKGESKTEAESSGGIPSYQKSKALKEAYNAKIARLEFQEKEGSLVNAKEVKRQAFEEARRVRNALQELPARLAPELVAKTELFDVQKTLEEAVYRVLENLGNHES